MLFSDSYLTIDQTYEAILREKGSRFLAFAFPVQSEADIKAKLSELRKEHPNANHHCYAWRLGPDKLAFRANDDGEPSNTAGKPIFSQIQSRDLTNILVVVVRYFGGTLLGVSGLIAAYKSSASEVLNLAAISEKFIMFEYLVSFDARDVSAVMRLLKEQEAEIISNSYDDQSHLVFRVKKQNSELLESRFRNIYKARLEFKRTI